MTTTYTRNILKAFRAADGEDEREGMEWYREAHALALSLDPENVERAAGIIAVLSPMKSWPMNVRLARGVYAGEFSGTFKRNMDKARAMLDGAHPLDVLSGDKVIAFYHNILGSPDYVTIDRHAIDIAVGRPMDDKARAAYMGKRKRAELVEAYRRAAVIASREAGKPVHPHQIQAVTWVWWRKNRAVAFHG